MSTLGALLDGFANAMTLANLGWAFLGVTLGTAIGILPGIGPALTIALLLPLTAHLDPTGAFIMFAGLYYGAMYGGSTTSILLNTPGESGSIITAIEGNLMARQGRGAAALATAAIGSFVAGTIGTLLLTFVAPVMVKLAIKFSPAAYFSLMILAFTTVSAMLGASLLRGLITLFVGIGIGLVGTDKLTGQGRFTMGFLELLGGIDITVVAVGLFALGEALYVASRPELRNAEVIPVKGSLLMTREEWRRSWKPWLRGTFLGFPFGALPAGGTEIPDLPLLLRGEEAEPQSGGVRQGRHRRRRRAGSREQCGGGRRAGAAADPRAAHIGDGGDPAGRVPAIRTAARAAAIHRESRPGLDA